MTVFNDLLPILEISTNSSTMLMHYALGALTSFQVLFNLPPSFSLAVNSFFLKLSRYTNYSIPRWWV